MASRSVKGRLVDTTTQRLDQRVKRVVESRPIHTLTWELELTIHRDLEWLIATTKGQVTVEVSGGAKK
jgi:hypothetical protein